MRLLKYLCFILYCEIHVKWVIVHGIDAILRSARFVVMLCRNGLVRAFMKCMITYQTKGTC